MSFIGLVSVIQDGIWEIFIVIVVITFVNDKKKLGEFVQVHFVNYRPKVFRKENVPSCINCIDRKLIRNFFSYKNRKRAINLILVTDKTCCLIHEFFSLKIEAFACCFFGRVELFWVCIDLILFWVDLNINYIFVCDFCFV